MTSAGILLHRDRDGIVEVLLGHMGGPFWARKDAAAWSIPKGELDEGEEPVAAARREFAEELGFPPPDGELHALGSVVQSGRRKTVLGFALAGDVPDREVAAVAERPDDGSWVEIEWPRNSGRRLRFPEIDRAAWFDLATARVKLVKGQLPFLDRLEALLTTT
ncbi:NUDIX domain-containing protein [Pseudonocardia kujensis]|uniref:NUDIX domain-containing protein n=1 Tax=Pseudonocardia kujensis TaxID=1128675 RepID=UPI001E4CAA17|nr:NUDIX domain-containing protein [Pseudonocardia kujensis]MCE0765515.1 NUDIX domain-containing protein [Pseudonocardia kujensis]